MKRYLYHYTCLILSALQLTIVMATIIEYVDTVNKYGALDGADIAGLVIIFALLFLTAMLDRALRKVDDNNFFVDCLLLTLVSPFRFICQLITIVRLHIARAKGNYDFGERGSNYTFYYLLFNEKGKPRKKTPEQLERERIYKEINERIENEYLEAEHFLDVKKRSDGRYNVHIVPLCCVDDQKIYPFSVQNNSYHGERYITELYVDGKKIIYDVLHSNTISLSLKPGKYDFKVVVKGEVKPIMVTKKVTKVDKTFVLRDVYVGEEDVHLCVGLIYGSVITQYIQKYRYTKRVVREEFEYFKNSTFFRQVSLEALTELCDYWMAYPSKIDSVVSQYSITRNKK